MTESQTSQVTSYMSQVQVMNEQGEIVNAPLRPPELTDDKIRELYEKMLFIKIADQKALNLQRQGRMGTYPSVRGQEAIQVASTTLLKNTDWIVPAFRETGAIYMHGMPLKNIYLYWMGNEWGSYAPESVNILPVSIPVGSQMLHAVGIGMAATRKKTDTIAVTYFGDGATSEGDFHEAMNFATLYKTPVIFVCQNNQFAISVPRSKQTASPTLAQKAIAYACEGVQVDGNDLLACYAVCKDAVQRARTEKMPTFIEAVTYRLRDHTTSDDATRYRDAVDHESWKKKDPLLRLQKYLNTKNLWNEKIEQELTEKFETEIQAVAEEAEKIISNPADIFDYTYAEMPERLRQQKEELLEFIKRNPPKTH